VSTASFQATASRVESGGTRPNARVNRLYRSIVLTALSMAAVGAQSAAAAPNNPQATGNQSQTSPSQQGAPQAQGGSTASTYTFDLHNDLSLNVPPPDPKKASNPDSVVLCFTATHVESISQPVILKADSGDLEVTIAAAQRALERALAALGYYSAYDEALTQHPDYAEKYSNYVAKLEQNLAPGARPDPAVLQSKLRDVEDGLKKELETLTTNKRTLEKDRRELPKLADDARNATSSKDWVLYSKKVKELRARVSNAQTLSSQVAQDQASFSPTSGGADAFVAKTLNGLYTEGGAATAAAAAAWVFAADRALSAGIPRAESYPRCMPTFDAAPLEMGTAVYLRLDFDDISPAEWASLKLVTIGVNATATSPTNPTPIRASPSAPPNTTPGNASPGVVALDFGPSGSPGDQTGLEAARKLEVAVRDECGTDFVRLLEGIPEFVRGDADYRGKLNWMETVRRLESRLDSASCRMAVDQATRAALGASPPQRIIENLEMALSQSCSEALNEALTQIPEYGRGDATDGEESWTKVVRGLLPLMPDACRDPIERARRAVLEPPDERVKYVRIPSRLAGDSIVALTVNLIYTPPLSQSVPIDGQYYQTGSIVAAPKCYRAVKDSPAAPGSSDWAPTGIGMGADGICRSAPWNSAFPYHNNAVVAVSADCYSAKRGITYKVSVGVAGDDDDWQLQSCSSVASNQTAAADLTIPVVSQSLPPVHALSRFNLTVAVVFSAVQTRTYGFALAKTASTTCATQPATASAAAVSYSCVETGSTHIIDPVVFLTYYPRAIDAERSWSWKDLGYPGVSLGFSMSSPTSNYYLGISEEIQRNVQLTAGLTYAKTPRLESIDTFSPPPSAMSTAPPTVQRFTGSWYVGVSFNILGFIQSLFGGAAKATGGS
jgi:hypothetical protein